MYFFCFEVTNVLKGFLSPVGLAGERNGWMLNIFEPFLQPLDWGRSSGKYTR